MLHFISILILFGASTLNSLDYDDYLAQYAFKQFSSKRLRTLKQNVERMEEFNRANHGWKMGINQFSDLTLEEFSQWSSNVLLFQNATFEPKQTNISLPLSVNWTAMGAVTPVKDEINFGLGPCGACWAFSVTGAVEGAFFIKYGILHSFSEQQIVNCDKLDYGCQGGTMQGGLKWVMGNQALCTERSYPYIAKQGECAKSCHSIPLAISRLVHVTPHDPEALMQAVSLGPVTLAVSAYNDIFQHYAGGIITDPNNQCGGKNVDHGVLLVGYGEQNGTDYWLIKNEWNTTWGEQGYARILRTSEKGRGVCNMLTQAISPVLF